MKIRNILNLNLATITVAGLFSLYSCSDKDGGSKYWDVPETPNETTVQAIKPRYIWVDAAANFVDFANSKENIIRDLTLAKNAGFTDIVVDVRSTSGDILFNSPLCQQITSVNNWVMHADGTASYETTTRTETWDYLQAFIDEGHKLDLRIHAGFNTMVGGHAAAGPGKTPLGILYRDSDKREWATYLYNGGSPKNTLDIDIVGNSANNEKFVNPGNPEVQEYICNLLKDLAKYNLDGIVLDRGRYNNLDSDFSDLSRKQFEAYIGGKVTNWPADIIPAGSTNAILATPYSQYTKLWLEFRAKTIYEFMEKARNAVKGVNPDMLFGVYVGGWYNSYYNTGVNWASKNYRASANHQWASENFSKYGYAALMDQILIGAYANPKAVYGSGEWSMQGFCSQAKAKIGNDCQLVVGGPDVDWRWKGSSVNYTKDEILSGITNSVTACTNACDGYFLFDMIHLKWDPEKWEAVKAGTDAYLDAWNQKYGDKK